MYFGMPWFLFRGDGSILLKELENAKDCEPEYWLNDLVAFLANDCPELAQHLDCHPNI